LIILFLALYCVRIYPLLRHPSLWAEDANLFYGPLINQERNPLLPDFSIYAGQHWVSIHAITGAIYFIFSGNLQLLPLISCLASLSITVLMALVWLKSKLLIKSRRNREFVFGFILLAPSSWESLGNIANSYVYFFLGIFAIAGWILPQKRSQFIFEFIFFLVLSFTSICGLLIIVSLIFRAILNKSRIYLLVPLALTPFLLLQLKNWTQRSPESKTFNLVSSLQDVIYIVIKRLGAETLLGQNGGSYFSSLQGWIVWSSIAFIPLMLICTTFVLFFRNTTEYDLFKFITIATLGGLHFALYIFASINIGLNELFLFGAGGRYLLVSHVTLFVLVIIVFDHFQQPRFRSQSNFWIGFTIFVMIIGVCFDFSLRTKTSPTYQLAWHNYSKCLAAGDPYCSVVVPPGGGWGINLVPTVVP
jgi:hypothetical protein